MTYLQPHRRPYQRTARIIGNTIALGIVLCVCIALFAPHIFPALFTTIARPFWRMEFALMSGSLRSPQQLLAENEMLRIQLEEMQRANQDVQFVQQENSELKTVLGRMSSSAYSTSSTSSPSITLATYTTPGILAAVLKRPPVSPYDELIIDIGLDYGISTTSLVYAPGAILIGRVIDVLDHTSKVRLFSSAGEKYEVLIGTRNAPATAVGRGGGTYEAQVSRDAQVREGDRVANPALSELAFGWVTGVISDPTQTFETILFAPRVTPYELRWVMVK